MQRGHVVHAEHELAIAIHTLARHQRLIGLDPGAKTIGVALTDVTLSLASPYGSIRRGKLRDNAAEIIAIARKEGAGGLVVGLPLSTLLEIYPELQR